MNRRNFMVRFKNDYGCSSDEAIVGHSGSGMAVEIIKTRERFYELYGKPFSKYNCEKEYESDASEAE